MPLDPTHPYFTASAVELIPLTEPIVNHFCDFGLARKLSGRGFSLNILRTFHGRPVVSLSRSNLRLAEFVFE
jgi:hypothetical protein